MSHRRRYSGGACRKCGCTCYNACVHRATGEPCHWVELDLCSACTSPRIRKQFLMPVREKEVV